MNRERRLGRGLEALLSQTQPAEGHDQHGEQHHEHGHHEQQGEHHEDQHHDAPQHAPLPPGEQLAKLNVYEIDTNPYQPRTEFDSEEITNLSASIKQHGVLQPIVVRRAGDRFQLIAGERRLRASIQAGMSDVPATIRDVDDREVAEITIVENLQRQDLGPLEKATSFQKYLEQYQATQEDLAGRLNIDRSTISNLIRLLELPGDVQQALREQKISAGHARALLPLGEEREQLEFCKRIQSEHLSVRATEKIVAETNRAQDGPIGIASGTSPMSPRDSQLASLEQELRAAVGTKVDLRQAASGKGKITLHFKNNEEFDRLRELLTSSTGLQEQTG